MGIALFATYYRFVYHLPEGAAIPWIDISCTFALIGFGVVGKDQNVIVRVAYFLVA